MTRRRGRRLGPRTRGALVVALVAGLLVTSLVALPLLDGGLSGLGEESTQGDQPGGQAEASPPVAAADEAATGGPVGMGAHTAPLAPLEYSATAQAQDPVPAQIDATADGGEGADGATMGDAAADDESPVQAQIQTQTQTLQEHEDAVEAGVDQGIELVQAQGVEVSQEQRAAAVEAASESVAQHQEAEVEQVQEATAGAVHGTLIQEQRVNVTQIQHAVGGATDGALAQHQTATASQLQSATWGATHGAIAQEQRVTVEQLQVATFGAAAGAASEAGEYEVDEQPKIQEAAQGAAYGVLTQYQKLTAEQRQTVTVEHVQHAAIGAASGALEGSSELALEQEQEQQIDIEQEQRQAVTIKEIQTAAKGAAKGALVQKQTVTVEQTQSAAWGASAGALKQVQSVHVEQIQQITTPKIEEAAKGAATGAITQSQEATVEQIQAAADGGAQGVLVQRQDVSVTQIQSAATGASKGAVASAIQYQVVEIEQIQSVAFGAGEGAVIQKQVVDITQVQHLAMGSAEGALTQHQEATVTQLQVAASTASQETARAIQHQRISVTQLQLLTAETAADATGYAVDQGIDDGAQLVQYVEIELVQRIELIDELEGTASLSFPDQNTTGETVNIASVDLSEGGFVAVYDDTTAALDPEDVIGVSGYLEPGEHGDVAVELEEPLEDDRSLVAAVHHDTTDDETFRYVERDGGDDEPYVTEGGAPVLDMAFITVDPDEPDEPEAELSVSDQTGDGETLTVEEATATVDYVVSAVYDDQRVDSESIDAGETVSELELDLDPPIESDGPVSVAVHAAADDEVLASDTIEYTLDDPFDPESTLSVSDQTGDGTSVTIDEANASVEYALTVGDGDGDQLTETEPFPAGEGIENESIELETPLTENALLDVSLVATEENQTLETASLEYTVDEEFQVEFVNCTRTEVTGSFEEGETVAASTGFYDSAGFGNTIIEDFVTIGEEVEAPFTGTIVFEIGAEDDFEGAEDDEGTITVGVPDYGTFGTYISGISSDEAIPFASIDHPNPQAQECNEDARPEEPSISVAETEPGEPTGDDGEWAWGEDTIDVTFSSENPNEEALPGVSEFVEGTTEDEPVGALEPGNQTFTVEWTPVDEDEQLVWEFGLVPFGYEEPLIAETDPAGEVVDIPEPDDPATFEVEITDTNSPVTQGEPLEIETFVENVGDESGEQEIQLALDDTPVDTETVELGTNPTETITLEADTTEFEPGEYTATVESENDTDETPITIEEPADPAEFAVEITGTNSPVEQGDELQLEALVENGGDEAGEQALEFALGETVVDSEAVALESGASETVAFSTPTDDLAPGEYTATVASENETDETTVTVTEPAAAEFSLVDLSAPPTDVAGQQTTVVATIANTGDGGDTQTVTYSVDGEIIEERTVSLEPGETTVEQFTPTLPEGESAHTIATENAEQTVVIEGLAVLPDEAPDEESPEEEQPDETLDEPEPDGNSPDDGSPSEETPTESPVNGDQTGDQDQNGAETDGADSEGDTGDVTADEDGDLAGDGPDDVDEDDGTADSNAASVAEFGLL
ncbi:hypothetical protein C483_05368 [Natrialba hulunbeirensis JCM 10989]|uniref:Uncharacterized protein n=1 Tax=Natrialba hulunbeirensis JCM 10989 TaxID=1227493 RepID=M0A449_9EURY|nr:CARDB domain-containing protein [Natrialba hulunbeirensis]ELY93369.1 hypothetical protein C483_05368 [Natrialba hulunbeirensis JCM 10989]